VAKVAECLPNKQETLSLNLGKHSPHQKKKEKKRKNPNKPPYVVMV
jgi:hypothetical protein